MDRRTLVELFFRRWLGHSIEERDLSGIDQVFDSSSATIDSELNSLKAFLLSSGAIDTDFLYPFSFRSSFSLFDLFKGRDRHRAMIISANTLYIIVESESKSARSSAGGELKSARSHGSASHSEFDAWSGWSDMDILRDPTLKERYDELIVDIKDDYIDPMFERIGSKCNDEYSKEVSGMLNVYLRVGKLHSPDIIQQYKQLVSAFERCLKRDAESFKTLVLMGQRLHQIEVDRLDRSRPTASTKKPSTKQPSTYRRRTSPKDESPVHGLDEPSPNDAEVRHEQIRQGVEFNKLVKKFRH